MAFWYQNWKWKIDSFALYKKWRTKNKIKILFLGQELTTQELMLRIRINTR